jgi:predicted Mrr-cat superfamily restriction endonuclease
VAVIDFGLRREISEFVSQQALRDYLFAYAPARYKYTSVHKAAAAASQLWKFVYVITAGDIVIIPSTGIGVVAVGRVEDGSPYHLCVDGWEACFYVRPVDWRDINIPMSHFDPVLLRSLNIPRTVFQPNIHEAETQIEQVLLA